MTDEKQATVFCAWCRRVIEWGTHGISHGLCETCLPTVVAELEARLAPAPSRKRRAALDALSADELT